MSTTFVITGDIANQDGIIYLMHKVDGQRIAVDSTELVEGKFTFEGSVKGPEQYYLTFKNNKRANIPFINENAAIHIIADIKDPATTVINGSASQDVFKIYEKVMSLFNKKSNVITQMYRKVAKAKDSVKLEEVKAEYEEMKKARVEARMNFIKNNNRSYAAALAASQQKSDDANEIDDLVALLDASLMKCDLVIAMKEKADALRKVAIGQIAPDFTMNDPEENPITLSSLYGKGYILVDFWAAWCGPCRGENPNVVATYNIYHDKGFEILGVSYDDNKDKWMEAVAKDQLSWIHVSDLKGWQNLTAKLYCISGIPANVLLDKEGRIIAKNLRGEALKEKLSELLD